MEHQPVIGITVNAGEGGSVNLNCRYTDAVIKAGGLPVILPLTENAEAIASYAALCDGILFSGGADVAPAYYGEETAFSSVSVQPERDAFELALFHAFYKTGKPIFGICRGIQLINVAMGGSLYQHIENHRQSEARDATPFHVSVDRDSLLFRTVGKADLQVNSFHHQAIKTPADKLQITAWADDKTAEAAEQKDHPFLLAVQWHPECFLQKDSAAQALFAAFVRACAVRCEQE